MEPTTTEITREVLLCNARGDLNPEAVGWSRKPLHQCNLQGRFPRKKKWDYWCITSERFLFSATIAHIDYLSLGAVYFLEYETGRYAEKTGVKFFSRHPVMGEIVGSAERFNSRGLDLMFEQCGERLRMKVQAARFQGKPLDVSVSIHRPAEQESLNVVIPWNQQTFQFTSKQECLPASGVVKWGDEELRFNERSDFACLDYGRGIWPYRTKWNWASFSGYCGSDLVGLNMGAKWTDGTGANENGILLNGRLFKLFEDIAFEYDDANFMKPWRMTSTRSDAVALEFTPFYDRAGALNLMIISARTHQLFGRFNGMLRVDGESIKVENMLGWAEEHNARW